MSWLRYANLLVSPAMSDLFQLTLLLLLYRTFFVWFSSPPLYWIYATASCFSWPLPLYRTSITLVDRPCYGVLITYVVSKLRSIIIYNLWLSSLLNKIFIASTSWLYFKRSLMLPLSLSLPNKSSLRLYTHTGKYCSYEMEGWRLF